MSDAGSKMRFLVLLSGKTSSEDYEGIDEGITKTPQAIEVSLQQISTRTST